MEYYYELYHHGIKGMKWGVRRFQNKNGSLTPAGRKRYSDDPTIVDLKNKYEASKITMKEAEKAYNNANNKASYLPTKKNFQESDRAFEQYKASKVAYDNAKLKYTTAKETARIKDKGITFDNKSKHRLKLEEQYKKLGMTDEEAQAAANKRIRTEKILAGSAALAVTACAAYVANKKLRERIDGVIKAGEKMQRIEMQDTGGKLYDAFYVAKGDRDMKLYERLLGYERYQRTGEAYVMNLESAKDIKVASQHNAAKMFADLYNTDADFRKSIEREMGTTYGSSLRGMKVKKAYEDFNRALTITSHTSNSPDTRFYSKLKKAGYGAIQDINDMKYSGYGAKNPLIVFDNSKGNVMVKSVTRLTNPSAKDATVESIKGLGSTFVNRYLATYGTVGAAALTGAAVTTYTSDPSQQYQPVR